MASMRITVDELRFKKAIYSKAAKNLREVIATVKKAANSIGNDRMFAEARSSLRKLAENMERRAAVLEALAEALVYSADTYKGAQTHSVSKISEYRAHKTDFYGNPVHVSGAAGGAAAAAGTVAAANTVSSGTAATTTASSSGSGASSGTYTQAASAGSGGAAAVHTTAQTGTASAGAGTGASTESSVMNSTAPSESYTENFTDNSTVNITNNTVVNNITETVIVNGAADSGVMENAGAGFAAETASFRGPSAVSAADVAGAVESSSASGAGMFAAGAATAAGLGAAAFGAAKIIDKKLKPEKKEDSLDSQLEKAKKRLQAIENQQDELKAAINENSASEDAE